MKILFDATPLLVNKTGVAYYTEHLVVELARLHPDDVQLVGFYYNFLGRRESGHLIRSANLNYTTMSLLPSKVIFQLRRFGIETPVELLAMQSGNFILYDNFLSYPSLFHTPSAPVIHDLTYIDLPDYVSPKLRSDLVRFVPKAIERSAFIITVSEFCKQRIHMVYGTPLDDIVVTHIPPKAPLVIPEGRRTELLHKLGISKPYLLFLGTIEPRKNIPNLIDAYRQLPERLREEYSLIIAGGIGWNCEHEVAMLQDAETAHLDVRHLGYVTDEQRALLYQCATLFVHASHYEGFGMPILEAMSYGLPCAISDIPIYHEIAADAAVYFDQDDSESISKTIQRLLEDHKTRRQLSAGSKKHVDGYHWEPIVQTIYERIKQSLS